MELWSAFLIGLAGSLHCAGMCGPLLVALLLSRRSRLNLMLGRIIYNAGRISTYMLLGVVIGTFGSASRLFGFQQNMSVMLGIAILLLVVMPRRYKNKLMGLPLYQFYNVKLQTFMGKVLKNDSFTSMLLLGILNGLLPCGLVYAGLAGALTTAGLKNAVVFMMLFGLGTLPLMFTISIMGQYAGLGLRRKLSRSVPFLSFLLGLIFIFRGLNLGIPYLSPKLPGHIKQVNVKTFNVKSLQVHSSRPKPQALKPQMNYTESGGGCCK
ncbi:MAG: sulfite exporter TauE/SafE family protein [Ignavibacteria bacterium]|jgi:sulfite exporter TauE/SafE|nr:sulfite exporter TauE/SafE family protein [Ignavibacteria bacterium]MCU7503582.1 sulfite exporter TauE/SafE family protein [Ignavibacteria bacterium]MCU7516764.1 sulfite exporter TauE/SafE family protein [Ignavibacteria bacterium]